MSLDPDADMLDLVRRIAEALETIVRLQEKALREMQDHHRDFPPLPEVPQPPN